jgi:hypothetical protein
MFPGSRIILPCVAFLFALPCFHLVLNTGYPRVGQFSCMTFTTVLMSQYAVYEDGELEIYDVALTRAYMVTLGVLVGLFATSYVWPYEARVELRQGLSDFFVNLNLLYHKMTEFYSTPIPKGPSYTESTNSAQETDPLLTRALQPALTATEYIERSTKEFLALEMLLQVKLLKIQDLLALTRNEPRLKGTFPRGMYARIISHCQSLIDRMLTMRTAVTDATWIDHIRRDLVRPVQAEWRRMSGNIELYMYTIAAALLMKLPIPAYLPPAGEAWKELIRRVRSLPQVRAGITIKVNNVSSAQHNQSNGASSSTEKNQLRLQDGSEEVSTWNEEDERFVTYFAYVLATGTIIKDLEEVGKCLCDLYGVVGGRDQQDLYFGEQS